MRTISANILAALSASTVKFVYMVRLDFDSGVVAWNSGFRDIVLDDVTYMAVGFLSSLSDSSEEPGVQAASFNVGVAGIDPDVVALMLLEPYLNRKATIYFTLLDENDVQIVGTPYVLFKGAIDQIDGTMGEDAAFSITLKSRLSDWQRARNSNYTDIEQQRLYPGDKGFEFVAGLSQRKLVWPLSKFFPDPKKPLYVSR